MINITKISSEAYSAWNHYCLDQTAVVKDIFLFFVFSSARAEAYKEDGNYEYKRKNFKEAIAAYTEGIKIKCDDAGLNAILYTNRATAQFCLGISQINQILIFRGIARIFQRRVGGGGANKY